MTIKKDPSFVELSDRIKCNNGLILVQTYEETRILRELLLEFKNANIHIWTSTNGLHKIKLDNHTTDIDSFQIYDYPEKDCLKFKTVDNEEYPTTDNVINALTYIESDCRKKDADESEILSRDIFILLDGHTEFDNDKVIRKFRSTIYLTSMVSSNIVVVGPNIATPENLFKDAACLKFALPNIDNIANILDNNVHELIRSHNNAIENGADDSLLDINYDRNIIINAGAGLTEEEFLTACNMSLQKSGKLDPDIILNEKRNIINKTDILDFWECHDDLTQVGGFGNLKDWNAIQTTIMNNPEKATDYAASPSKGTLILGVQGSGKSFISSCIAKSSGKSIIKLDMTKIFDSLVGSSEKRLRTALAQAEAVKGILMIDELEKALSGASGSSRTDGGTTARVIGYLLTWLQEEHPGVFIVATANDIHELTKTHPELFRSGRFDKIWFSDCPTFDEKKEIFSIHLKKKYRDPKKFDLNALAKVNYEHNGKTYKYTGAEIEQSIKNAINAKLSENIAKKKTLKIGNKFDITTDYIIEHLIKIKPITLVGKDGVARMRSWAKENAENVSLYTGDNNTINTLTKKKRKRNLLNINNKINL